MAQSTQPLAVRHGNQPNDLPTYATLAEWQVRAAHLRRRILVSAGLWPTPERCPLNPRITGRIEHDDYTIENVYFESWPGFYVCGNLYRPRSQGSGAPGPHPGLLCPHGHWARGRLHDEERGSIPARCITFARQGYVAFAYDMVGYNDSGVQLVGRAPEGLGDGGPVDGAHRGFFHGPREALWGVSPLGLQLWNSVRALDYMETLPDVDPGRLGCTGASGGGTQTFTLAAIDERVRVAAPVNMISAHFQGGCDCENAPNLRLDGTNVEIGALMAPRPLLMVSATGDWTVNTPWVEFPAVQAVYRLYGAEERVATVQVDAPHNYNRQSRAAVYAWFGRWLLGEPDEAALRERPYTLDPPERMRVWASAADLPAEAATPEQLTAQLVAHAQAQIEALRPRDAATLHAYRETMGVAYRYALNAELPDEAELVVHELEAAPGPRVADSREQGEEAREQGEEAQERGDVARERGGVGLGRSPRVRDSGPGQTVRRLALGRASVGERVPVRLYEPDEGAQGAVLVVHSEGAGAAPGGLIDALLDRGRAVLTLDAGRAIARDHGVAHFSCFNRTDAALRVQEVLTALAYLRTRAYTVPGAAYTTHLVGLGRAGLLCLLARALAGSAAGRTVVDAGQFPCDDDDAWVKRFDLPLLRRAGDLRTAVALSASGPLWIHNAAPSFPAAWCRQVYAAASALNALHVQGEQADWAAVVEWLI